jgi:hypothetical protein
MRSKPGSQESSAKRRGRAVRRLSLRTKALVNVRPGGEGTGSPRAALAKLESLSEKLTLEE